MQVTRQSGVAFAEQGMHRPFKCVAEELWADFALIHLARHMLRATRGDKPDSVHDGLCGSTSKAKKRTMKVLCCGYETQCPRSCQACATLEKMQQQAELMVPLLGCM